MDEDFESERDGAVRVGHGASAVSRIVGGGPLLIQRPLLHLGRAQVPLDRTAVLRPHYLRFRISCCGPEVNREISVKFEINISKKEKEKEIYTIGWAFVSDCSG